MCACYEASTMLPTTEHWRIQKWAQEHSAHPAEVRVLKFDGEPATLTFILGDPDVARPDIYPISWVAFFAQFDLLKLSMAFDDGSARFDIVRVEKPPDDLTH